jgi:hypothetical protein
MRTCDYPQVVSTSGSFAQCCPLSGACPFYTACSSNTLLAASGSAVPCDVDPGLTCNTAILAATAGADGGASYLACWQSTLGSSAFTFVQDIGSACKSCLSSSAYTKRSLTILSRSSTSFDHKQGLGRVQQRFSDFLDSLQHCFVDCFRIFRLKLLNENYC